MDKDTYLLMDRDALIKLSIVEKIVDKDMIEDLYLNEPFVCHLLLDSFKDFLNDDRFEKVERQIILFKFLKNNYPIELCREIVEYVNACDLHEDYIKLLMEWNYFASDHIKQSALSTYDIPQLAFDKQTKKLYDYEKENERKRLDVLDNLTRLFLEPPKDNESSEGGD